MTLKKIGVIGAGQMGGGIAQVCAAAGYSVALNDISKDRFDACLAKMSASLKKRVESGKLNASEADKTLKNIQFAGAFSEFSDCDLVIESASENEAIKTKIFEALQPHLSENCILGSNTSSLSITRLAAASGRPEKFMGIHFMNPVPVMELVELIKGIATSPAVFETVHSFALSLGKKTAISEDYPAFIVNRILLPMINEAIFALYEGVGDIESIDKAMKLGANQPMGPLELADFIGLDTCLAIMRVLYDGFADSKYRPCPLLVKYVEAGWLGRKTKRGFYDYAGEKPVPTR